ncbi:MAG: hypothetical protein SGBAC_008326 [Bacillariaceae sp.]
MAPQCKHEIDNNVSISMDEISGNTSSSSLSSSVRFSLNMEEKVILVESHKDYTPEEFARCFYTESDQGKMRSEQLSTIARMEKGKKPKKEDYRGLESEEIAQAFQKNQCKCAEAVLAKQSEIKNPDALANISKSVTAEAAQKALLLAQRDAEEAEKVWSVQEVPKRRKSLPKRILSKLIKSSSFRSRQ